MGWWDGSAIFWGEGRRKARDTVKYDVEVEWYGLFKYDGVN